MSKSANITREQVRTVLIATELGGKTGETGQFSYAQLGSSSSSFGQMQFDVDANPAARTFLADNGFNAADIATLSEHQKLSGNNQAALDSKLQAIPETKLDQFTDQQLDININHVGTIIDEVREKNPAAADNIVNDAKLQLGMADYSNQFSSRHDGQLAGFLAGNLEHGIKAGTLPTREDVQTFIESTAYGRDKANAKGVKSREERLEGALYELGLSDSPQVSKAGATLKEHSHGAAVLKLQGQLAEFGYTDAKGRPLQTDGDFGPGTQAAVKAFQLDHGLTPDGKVGTKTQSAMQGDLQPLKNDDPGLLPAVSAMSSRPAATPGLDDPRDVLNPNHTLYNTLKECIPDASDRRLLQFTAACHSGQISAENLGGVHFDRTEGRMTFFASWPPGAPASVDLKTPSPEPQQSIQQISQYGHQQTQIQAQVNAHIAQTNAQAQQGPVLGGSQGPMQ